MKQQSKLLYWPAGAMEFCWLYAWAYFLGLVLFKKPVPFPEAALTFALAGLIVHFSTNKGWRVWQVWGLHIVGFSLAGIRLFYGYGSASGFFFDYHWFTEWLQKPKGGPDIGICLFVLFWVFLFWWGGVRLRQRLLTQQKIKTRLDVGLAAFFLLFLVKFIAAAKGTVLPVEPVSLALVFPFLFLGFAMAGLAQNRQATQKDFLPGYRGQGALIGFVLIFFILIIGVMTFSYPYLLLSAERGYDLVRTAARSAGPVLAAILRFMIIGRGHGSAPAEAPQEMPSLALQTPSAESSGWIKVLEDALLWGLWGLLGLMFIMVLVFIARHWLLPWFMRLLARTALQPDERPARKRLSRWAVLLEFLLLQLKRLTDWAKGYARAAQVYGALLRWGRLSGSARIGTETPREYGLRLGQRFPKLGKDITAIIEAFHKEVYAETGLNEQEWFAVRQAWRRLCSPLQWPLRIKGWVWLSSRSELQAKEEF
ncbi:MAG: DUF4129 domain-containing protein [Desulfobacteraceae bacterium]|nr:MAG: DUF4129 domain-containing protein [Desulfobacteraceae bacterium]